MNLVEKLLLVTCVFAITRHAASADQDPEVVEPTYSSYGSDSTIECKINGAGLRFRLVRDRDVEDACPRNSTWCSLVWEEERYTSAAISSSIFKILNLNATHNYTCEAYNRRNEKIAATAIHTIIVGVGFGEPCETSEQCLVFTECDPEKRRCFCIPGYGIEKWNSNTCKKYPFQYLIKGKIEEVYGGRPVCVAHMSNFTEMHWYLNGQKYCSPATPVGSWCSENQEETDPEKNIFSSNVRMRRINRNENYSCVAVTTDEQMTTVSTFLVIADPVIKKSEYKPYGSEGLIECEIPVIDIHFRLVRDGDDEPCPLNTTWCSLEESYTSLTEESYTSLTEMISTGTFRILSLTANHTYTCEAYNDRNEKIATTAVHTINVEKNLKDPEVAESKYNSYGNDSTIECKNNGTNMQFRLVRDEDQEDPCPINTTWCSLEKQIKGLYATTSSSTFKILNLNATHNYTCVAYGSQNEKFGATAIHTIIVGPKPKILNFTLSPPDSDVPKRTKIVATARFQWYSDSAGEPDRRWRADVYNKDQIDIKDELKFISGNEYESKVTIGSIEISSNISFEVCNIYGKDEKSTHVIVTAKYGEKDCIWNQCPSNSRCNYNADDIIVCTCDYKEIWDGSTCHKKVEFGERCETSAQCPEKYNNTQCNPKEKICLCTPGFGMEDSYDYHYMYYWSACEQYPFKEDKKVKFEMDLDLECIVHMSELTEIRWIRNEHESCISGSTWCSQQQTETVNPKINIYKSKVTLKQLVTDGTYSCQAVTRDGRNFTVKITDVKVDPSQHTLYSNIGGDETINCTVKTPSWKMRLIRDGKETCTTYATWCFQRETTTENDGRTTSFFDVLNLQTNHTYSCDAYKDNLKLATVAVYYIQVGSRPKIIKMTKTAYTNKNTGIEVIIQSYTSENQLVRRWTKYDGSHVDVLQDRTFRYVTQPENQYQCEVTLPWDVRASIIRFEVSNNYGYDTKYISVGVGYGEKCDSATSCVNKNAECDRKTGMCLCHPGYAWDSSTCCKSVTYLEKCDSTVVCATNNTQCDRKTEQCLCRKGYKWDSSTNICRKNGAMGMFAVKKEGIVMLALTILFTLFRSTTSTAC